MDARVVVYTHDENKDDLEAKARAGVIPIVTSTPGYISYGVIFEDDRVVSISQWESEAHAKAADAALAEWVNANTTIKSETRFTGDLAWLELASGLRGARTPDGLQPYVVAVLGVIGSQLPGSSPDSDMWGRW